MDSTITHVLDGTGQARYGGETAAKVWIDDHSQAMGQARYGGETAVKAWIRRSLTS